MAREQQRQGATGTSEVLKVRFGLTEAEAGVAILVADGLMYSEIAEHLSISPHTVHTHVKGIHRKLEVHSNGRAAALIRGLEKKA